MHGAMPVIHNSTARNTDSHGDALQTEEGSRKLCSYLYIEIWVGGTRKFVSHSTYLNMNNEPANLRLAESQRPGKVFTIMDLISVRF